MNPSVLAVDIGGTSTKVGLVDPAGQLHGVDSIPTLPDGDSYFESLCTLIHRTQTTAHHQGVPLSGIGVAVAGFLTASRERLLYNPNLPWLERFPLRDRLAAAFHLSIELEVDSNAACMAEYTFGCGAHSSRFLCVTAGTGLGVGMTVDGSPLRFAYGCLGDIGHIVVQPGGPICACGGRGCAETLISAPAIAARFNVGALKDVIEAAHQHDATAVALLNQAGEYLGLAIASMANILFPDRIAIAGGLSAAGDFVLQPAERVFRESAGTLAQSGVPFERANLGPSATLIGAAWPFWTQQNSTVEVPSYGESIAR